MRISRILLPVLIAACLHSAAQAIRFPGFALDCCLQYVQSADSNALLKQQIDSIRNMLPQPTLQGIGLQDKWSLSFYEDFGWTDMVPFGHMNHHVRYISTLPGETYTTATLLDTFALNRRVIDSAQVLRFFPPVFDREDPLNRGWSLIAMSDDNLIIRYVHSYPNGNQTSWYTERVYYFRRRK
jgi:hypothetical protein